MRDTTRRWIGLVAAAITATTGLVAITTAPAQVADAVHALLTTPLRS